LNNVDVSTLNEERKNFMELNLDGRDKDAVEDKLKDHVQLSSKHNANTSMYLFIKDHKCSDKNTVKLTDLNNTLSTIWQRTTAIEENKFVAPAVSIDEKMIDKNLCPMYTSSLSYKRINNDDDVIMNVMMDDDKSLYRHENSDINDTEIQHGMNMFWKDHCTIKDDHDMKNMKNNVNTYQMLVDIFAATVNNTANNNGSNKGEINETPSSMSNDVNDEGYTKESNLHTSNGKPTVSYKQDIRA
jgi:hypothetical protein